ncbi:glycosyltransferase family protein [Pedobacter sp. P351]|uniref:glycosyltransferase family protein n=1 Tax=Pedobacter superstes TaxID=3133441 RepID=UPI00309EB6C5
MKILYAIQGTGNGHLSRAMDIIPCLQKHGEVDILVSGIQGDLNLPFPITYQYRGLSFIFGKTGGVNLWKTFARTNLRRFFKNLNDLPLEGYNLILNDFEPVSAWACYFKRKACVGLSHQAAVLTEGYALPESVDRMGRFILDHYAPVNHKYGFHFSADGDNVFTPVIRQQVREHIVSDEGHYTVYLPSYDDKRLIKQLSEYKEITWQIFSKHNKKKYESKNITIFPIDNKGFTASMASSSGVLCGAGFETPAEALFLGKKLLVIPMKNQYEQHLNAAALKSMDVSVVKNLKPKNEAEIREWLDRGRVIPVNYPNQTQEIIDSIVAKHAILF